MSDKIKLGMIMLVLLVSACKKEDLPPDEAGPTVFGMVGTIDNVPVTIEAGVDDYYMYSSYSFSASDSIYEFTGELKRTTCGSVCPRSLTISIRNNNKSTVDINNIIKPGQLEFRAINGVVTIPSDSIRLRFQGEAEGFGPFVYQWDLGPYGMLNGDTPSISLPLAKTQISACLTVTDINTASNTLCDTISIDTANNCTANFNVVFANSALDTMVFQPLSSVNNNHLWDFGDGNSQNTSGTGFVSHTYSAADSSSIFYVRLTSDNGAGCKQTVTKGVHFEATPSKPLANYSYEFIKFPPTTVADSTDFSKVTITWTDDNGKTYTSRSNDQPSTSTFEILETENYPANEKGELTIKFTARVNCRLYNGATFIEMKNTIVKFAVAYPG